MHVIVNINRMICIEFLLYLSHKLTCIQPGNYNHYCHLLLLSLKADTHFTLPWRVEG